MGLIEERAMRRTSDFCRIWNKAQGGHLLLAAAIVAIGTPATLAAQTALSIQPAAAVNAAPSNGVGSAFELTFWQSVDGSDDPAVFDAYLARYPEGTFSGLAHVKIAALQRAQGGRSAMAQPVPASVPAVAAAPVLAVLLEPEPAPTPSPAVAMQQTADMVPTKAVIPPAEQSTPLARLLAQLRGKDVAAPVAPDPIEVAQAAAPVATSVSAPAAPANPYASARPVMLPVPEVPLPAHFCSTDARNAFHNNAYRPVVEAARRNNEAAVSYLRQLQQTYDRGQLGRDTAVLNAISAEARAYQTEAAQAYTRQAALVRQFDALMAVPLRTCMASAQ
jgi:hypothetical protein